jgi:toxin ParE1/3/4
VARRLHVILAPRFIAEMKHQSGWIAERNARAAEAAEARVRVALRRLSRLPELGRPGRVEGTRELSVPRTRFIIVYRRSSDSVEVAALLHSSQNWPSRF